MIEVILAVGAVVLAITGMIVLAFYGRKDGLLGDWDFVGRLIIVIAVLFAINAFWLHVTI